MNLRKVNDEVFLALDPIVRLGDEELAFLKTQALASPRKRARICAHKSNDDPLHEMLIVISSSSYIHPHRHVDKSESFHIVDGEVDVVVFDADGNIMDVVELGAAGTGRSFFYRLAESAFHTLLIKTDYLIVHEVTNGPFARDKTILAPFAPAEDRVDEARAYITAIAQRASEHKSRNLV